MATYYIDPFGVDTAGRNGSISQEWATLSYACSRVTTSGDIIYVNAGSYNETAQCILSVGVSIEGAGRLFSIITATSTLTNFIYAISSGGTNGNQSISNITLDCNLLVTFGIRVYGRSNFSIYDCGIKNAINYGLTFTDQPGRDVDTAPTTWATGNLIYNNYFVNCGSDSWYVDSYWAASAAIDISGQDGMLIYNNNIDNKTGGRYAYGIKGLYGGGYHKGLKIYDNIIRTNIRDNVGEQSFGFNIEIWTGVGGIEIYGNDLNGAIDMGGRGYWDDYSYGFAMMVHDNIIVQDTRPTNQGEAGLVLESGGEGGCYFYNNWVENFSTGLTLGTTAASLIQGYDNVWIYYNVMCNLGYVSGGVGAGISGYNLSTGVIISNLYILNNVIHKVNNSSGHGVSFEYSTANTWTNINIKNNIIYNAYTPIQFRSQIVNSVYIYNNLTYGSTRSIDNATSWQYSTITTREIVDNQEGVDPLFTSVGEDFTLTETSTCINSGVNVGLTSDYIDSIIYGLPDIGAYEYFEGEDILIPNLHLYKIAIL